jgi:ABC-2 type transport system permease protein
MRPLFTVARRELGSYFFSPVFWVIAAAFLFLSGLIFAAYVMPPPMQQQRPEASMAPFLGLYSTIFLFVAPLLSMRLLSEEQRSGTLELLMTAPVRDWQVVVGKWLAALAVSVVIIALTLVHAYIMSSLAERGLAAGPLATGYLGLVLMVGALLAVGVCTSALTENQVVAAFLGIMGALVLWFLGFVGMSLGDAEAPATRVLRAAGLGDHLNSFNAGLLDTRDLLYFVVIIVGALYLATRVLESRRWR